MSAVPTPAQTLTQLLAGAWLAQAIAVMAKLGVADLLSTGPRTPAELAAATGSEATAMYRLLRALAGAGIFAEDDGRFGLTPLAGPLRSDAADSIRAYAVMAGERWVWQSVGGLEHSLRTGAPAFEQIFGASLFDYYAAHPDAARVGAEGLKSVGRGQDAAVAAAYDFAGAGTVVDVGGGQGRPARRHPRSQSRRERRRVRSAPRGGHGAPAAAGERACRPLSHRGRRLLPRSTGRRRSLPPAQGDPRLGRRTRAGTAALLPGGDDGGRAADRCRNGGAGRQ